MYETSDVEMTLNLLNDAGWWYKKCHRSLLTGLYLTKYILEKEGRGSHSVGIHWDGFRGLEYSLKSAEMLIRPKDILL